MDVRRALLRLWAKIVISVVCVRIWVPAILFSGFLSIPLSLSSRPLVKLVVCEDWFQFLGFNPRSIVGNPEVSDAMEIRRTRIFSPRKWRLGIQMLGVSIQRNLILC